MPYTPTLEWNDVTNAISYTLEYADNAAFTNSTTVTGLTTSQYTFTDQLSNAT